MNQEILSSKIYKVPLMDTEGNIWEIEACGIMEITSEVPKIDVSKMLEILEASELKICRPWGKIELLIGTDYAGLMPVVLKTVGNLQLMKNAFGYCIRGLPSTELMLKLNCAMIRINHSNCSYRVEEIDIIPLKGIGKQIEEFLSVEGLGVQCSPTPVEKCFKVTYPFTVNPKNLPNNYFVAKARLQSLERRLKLNGAEYTGKYCDQINDMINRDVARKLTREELETYKGPAFYFPHYEDIKPESESTPLRIVFNSSASYTGISLNDCLAKGPDILTNMMGILLRFHLPPEEYVLTRVAFGDKPSSVIAILALQRAARLIPLFMNQTEEILDKGGFKIKHWIISGDDFQDVERKRLNNSDQEKVLGLIWNSAADYFSFKIKLNFSRKRIKIGWDDPVSQPEREQWKVYFKEMYEVERIHFPRCIRPTDAIGDPGLIIFSDAILAAKNKLAPSKHMSIPRLQLWGAVMACRLKEFIEKEMSFQFEFVKLVTDSSIVRSQITNDSLRFNTFVAGRISEIQSKSKVDEWYWTASEHNPADITTRPVKPECLDVESVWQKGPKYLSFSVNEWPLVKNVVWKFQIWHAERLR
ncbi:uncharacterized protein LOC119572051 [Penaeus monodon]|uniref:uncharacterized protein LOC119572051 n=1 Tax=Penaeus monodon TaxID=6687 RepID=UPI0018A7178C|nr:uncharacterized protein LOC119572051 [Penaeus monodon]